MTRRVVLMLVVVVAATTTLAGCSSLPAGSFTRAAAEHDAATWTKQAVGAARSAPNAESTASVTKANGFLVCRSDNAYFTTSSEWRTVTDVPVPLAGQAAATSAIVKNFMSSNWKASSRGVLTSLTGPADAKHKGLVTIQTGGNSAITVTAISPCYK